MQRLLMLYKSSVSKSKLDSLNFILSLQLRQLQREQLQLKATVIAIDHCNICYYRQLLQLWVAVGQQLQL